jgi:antitoxin MazE
MRTQIKTWGNSLALRIPKSFCVDAGLDHDSPVELLLTEGKLVIVPVSKQDFTLEQLLAQVTEENLHREVDMGPAVGNEVW